jgi:hypothetical protein
MNKRVQEINTGFRNITELRNAISEEAIHSDISIFLWLYKERNYSDLYTTMQGKLKYLTPEVQETRQ